MGNPGLNRCTPISSMESTINADSVDSNYPVNNNNKLLDYAGRVAGKILSAMPTPVGRIVLISSLIGSLGFGIACGSRDTPTPEPTPPVKEEPTSTQTPTINIESNYKVILAFLQKQ